MHRPPYHDLADHEVSDYWAEIELHGSPADCLRCDRAAALPALGTEHCRYQAQLPALTRYCRSYRRSFRRSHHHERCSTAPIPHAAAAGRGRKQNCA